MNIKIGIVYLTAMLSIFYSGDSHSDTVIFYHSPGLTTGSGKIDIYINDEKIISQLR